MYYFLPIIPILIIFALTLVVWAVCYLVRKYVTKGGGVPFRRFRLTAIILSVCWIVLYSYGYFFGRWRYEVIQWDYHNSSLPKSFDGYRVVHISDLHLEGFQDKPEFLDTIINVINQQDADMICFTGDLVSFSHDGLVPFVPALSKLKARDGVFAILGNHDYGIYDRGLDSLQREQDRLQLINLQRHDLGWHLLLNEHFILHHASDSIAIIGSENQACGMHQKVRRGNLAQAMEGTEGLFQLLLTHDPSHWDAEVVGKTNIPLTLSGHTHAMQLSILGLRPSRLLFKRSDGLYTENSQQLYVNIGLGGLMPFRVGATPEITVMTLHRGN